MSREDMMILLKYWFIITNIAYMLIFSFAGISPLLYVVFVLYPSFFVLLLAKWKLKKEKAQKLGVAGDNRQRVAGSNPAPRTNHMIIRL